MTNPTDELRTLIQATSGANNVPPRATSAHHARTADADIRTLAQQARPAGDAKSTETDSSKRASLITVAVAVVLLIGGGGLWFWSHPTLTGYPATLQQLSEAVAQYRSAHSGNFPEHLSNLASFPKDAVEWQLQHWKARDAGGRTEIMWAPNGPQHYRIVLRHGTEVWIYDDLVGQSRQIHP